ncbi:DUF4435 domain-containing protein [Listeria sp. SHR_NRA_18]|uniref:DUF4435 domain-containing protein n=1 Tax=Listeria sp. SHR_NRA_18 TaxID=2269046 RepID=UPI00051D11B3|nr:DUF4435 domain-containing protein [Listeria sp. SHR_NRA_18]KGL41227.1 hypothetical protein EP56_11595 [Listeriaceae bacterium FSL A5-0209]RQW67426.1 DUF4435 domain-containing protein [Listeria sp. SHR_NRA_18]
MSIICHSPDELATEIKMSNNKRYIVLEGNSDIRFWRIMLGKESDKYVFVTRHNYNDKNINRSNKRYVIETIKKVNSLKNDNSHFGVVDLDYDYIIRKTEEIDNIYYYNGNSLETALIGSNALGKVLTLFYSEEKSGYTSDEVRHKLLELSYGIGICRLISQTTEFEWRHSFSDIKMNKCYDKNRLEPDEEMLLGYIQRKFSISSKEIEIYKKEYQKYKDRKIPPRFICNGHDVLEVFENIISKRISPGKKMHGQDNIFNYLISMFSGHLESKSLPNFLEGSILLANIPDFRP